MAIYDMLIDFTDNEEVPRWIAINDDVMGGISQSRIELSPTATALFCGQLVLENNGGFASIRRSSDNYNLNACTGVILKVKEDGRTYQFPVKTDYQYDGVAYRSLFATDTRQWQTITLCQRRETSSANSFSLKINAKRKFVVLCFKHQMQSLKHVSSYVPMKVVGLKVKAIGINLPRPPYHNTQLNDLHQSRPSVQHFSALHFHVR